MVNGFDPDIHHRISIRLKGYDYSSPGAYYVTICTKNKECYFGEIREGIMHLNDAGCMVESLWNDLPDHYTNVTLDAFVVMPNHVHGIIVIMDDVGAGLVPARNNDENRATTRVAPTLCDIVGAFKSLTTNEYIKSVKQSKWPAFDGKLWQRNYYDHITRDEKSLSEKREYIVDNPLKWDNNDDSVGAGLVPALNI